MLSFGASSVLVIAAYTGVFLAALADRMVIPLLLDSWYSAECAGASNSKISHYMGQEEQRRQSVSIFPLMLPVPSVR
jgi:hypothetical protein